MPDTITKKPPTTDIEKFKLDVGDAITFTSYWREANSSQQNLLKAFTVNLDEIDQLIKEYTELKKNLDLKHPAMRFYLGKRPKLGQAEGGEDVAFQSLHNCLVITLVDGFITSDDGTVVMNPGTDICLYEHKGKEVSGCYDFTYPCPATCATDSPLYNHDNPVVKFEG